jgi:hypothetical protein
MKTSLLFFLVSVSLAHGADPKQVLTCRSTDPALANVSAELYRVNGRLAALANDHYVSVREPAGLECADLSGDAPSASAIILACKGHWTKLTSSGKYARAETTFMKDAAGRWAVHFTRPLNGQEVRLDCAPPVPPEEPNGRLE